MLPLALLGPIVSGVTGLFKGWQERKAVKEAGKTRIKEAKVNAQVRRIEADIQYDVIAAEGMKTSWKDELWTIWFIAVLTACFIPEVQLYVKDGFIFLKDSCPEWFTWCVLGSVVASFGLKDWFKKLMGGK